MNALNFAKTKNLPDTNYILADAEHLPIKENSIDKMVCAEIVEHLPDPDALFSEINRTLKKNGAVIITTPNEKSIWGFYEILWDLFGKGRNYGETHLKFYHSKEMKHLFKNFEYTKGLSIFFISPLFALLNNIKILEIGVYLDRFFENLGWGVSLLFFARK